MDNQRLSRQNRRSTLESKEGGKALLLQAQNEVYEKEGLLNGHRTRPSITNEDSWWANKKQTPLLAFEVDSSSTSFRRRFGTASTKCEIVKLDPIGRDGSSY
ncbi:hypothetical protein TNCV_4806851 [Trichonephila clavipes]|nr:hypothetical protein TNCV_4806851 [Trichonephila clavipes]